MIDEKSIQVLPKTERVSFLQTHVTAQQTIISKLAAELKVPTQSGAYNDAVLELNRLNFMLANAKSAIS